MSERPRDPTPLELFGRLAGAIQTIAEALNTDHPGHPCHMLASRVEATLLGMHGHGPMGLNSATAENAAQFGEPAPANAIPEIANPGGSPRPAPPLTVDPVPQTPDDGA